MHAEDRIIHFATELIHPPVEHNPSALQKLYFDLSQTRAAYDSIDITNRRSARFYARRGRKTQSIALFLPDRIAVIEEWADIALKDFLEKVREVASCAPAALSLPPFVAQTATIRSTFALTQFDDARVFLFDHACQQSGRITPHFGRPIAAGGLRFVLPETPEHRGNLHVTVESYRLSRNEIFVEVKGLFAGLPASDDALDTIADNVRAVRAFITDRVYPYLNQFEQPAEGLL